MEKPMIVEISLLIGTEDAARQTARLAVTIRVRDGCSRRRAHQPVASIRRSLRDGLGSSVGLASTVSHSKLVNDGKANQSDYSGDRDTLGKHLMAGSAHLPPEYEACNRPTQAERVEV